MTQLAVAPATWTCSFFGMMLGTALLVVLGGAPRSNAAEKEFPVLTDAEAWERLPPAATGGGQTLPVWARLLAAELPRSTAALLQLDLAQRTKSPVAPELRAAMRWVSAHANRCRYAEAYAAADARSAGVDAARLGALDRSGYPGWSASERAALEFARKMTLDSESVTDDEFTALVRHFG